MQDKLSKPLHFEYVELSNEGPLFIFLHGFMGNLKDWERVPFTPPRGLYIDLPFHGKSHQSSITTWNDCLRSLIDLISTFGGPRILVGYSLGGRIALQLISDHPNMFHGLFCESASFGIKDEQEREQRKLKDDLLFANIKDQEGFIRFLKIWYELPLFKAIKNKDDLISRRSHGDFKKYQKALQVLGPGNQPYIFNEALNYKNKIHFLAGTTDRKYCEIAKLWKSHGGKSSLFKGSSHNIHWDQPQEFARYLNDHYCSF